MKRFLITEKIIQAKVAKNLRWADVASKVGASKEWVTAACLGKMAFTQDQANTVSEIFDLSEEEMKWLTIIPNRGFSGIFQSSDPVICRFYEIINIYGDTLRYLIDEEFGDGIMSAIDFNITIKRNPDLTGDRVNINLDGKFLPYKSF